jgi:hypothetical protein
MLTELRVEGLKEGDNFKHPAGNGRVILKYVLIEKNEIAWTGFMKV